MLSSRDVLEKPGAVILPRPAAEERAAKLMMVSVMHSQGDFGLQDVFITQAVISHPEWTPNNLNTDEAAYYFAAKVQEHFSKGLHAPLNGEDIEENIEHAAKNFADVINTREEDKKHTRSIDRITQMILGRDDHFLVDKGGRPREAVKMKSFLCHYALLGGNTGAWEIDNLYKEVRARTLLVLTGGDEIPPHQAWRVRTLMHLHADALPASSKDKLLSTDPLAKITETE